jgi:very-short-patch-repair endonuclease
VDVHEALASCGARQQGMASTRQLTSRGVTSPQLTVAVQSGVIVRLRRGVYAPAPLALLPRFVVTDLGVAPAYVAHVRAVLLGLGASATASGRTAAALRGWPMLVEPSRTVHVSVPHGRATASGRHVRAQQRRTLAREQLTPVVGCEPLWVTSAVQTVLDCSTELPLLQAVVVCDSALRSGQVTVDELRAAAQRLPGVTHAERARRVVRLSDPLSGSVLESVLRVHLLLAGIGGFATQHPLSRPGGQPLLRVDFCFPAAGLIIEVDGQKWHQDSHRDRRLDNALVALGWRVLRYTWGDVVHDSATVLDEVRAALGEPALRVQSRVVMPASAA